MFFRRNFMDLHQQYFMYLEKVSAYLFALNTMSWDQLTIAPKKGQDYRNKMMAILSGEFFDISTSKEAIELIEKVQNHPDTDEVTKIETKQMLKEINNIRYIPREEYVSFMQLLGDSEIAWEKAKEEDNWELFKPYLEKIVAQTKKNVSYRKSDLPTYQQLLDDFEPGMTIEQYDEFFNLVKEKLVPIIKQINDKNIQKPALLDIHVSIEQQKQIIEILRKALDFKEDRTFISTSVHPFSSGFSIYDNRVTVAYHPDMFTSSIFSFIHEVGHATYNGQVDEKYQGRFIAHSMSYGMHESQSRMYENMLGRSKAFWENIYPQITDIVVELKEYSIDDFIFAINYVSNSFIRTEADELTYPLHVLIRYEIEKGLFNDELSVDDLPRVWNEKMMNYLQITPPTHALGVLQR